MPTCPICHRLCKTAQGLSGHMRFRHQVTVPKQDLPVYARDRIEKAENENARLREQVARLQRQGQDQETFYEKKMVEQKTELEKAQERKLAEQQRAISKQYEEQIQFERARAEEEAVAVLRKQIQDLKKRIEQLNSEKQKAYELGSPPETEGKRGNAGEAGNSTSEMEKSRQDLRRERDRARGSSPLPPLPDPLRLASSLEELRRWLFRRDKLE
jgi:hypothetical protein